MKERFRNVYGARGPKSSILFNLRSDPNCRKFAASDSWFVIFFLSFYYFSSDVTFRLAIPWAVGGGAVAVIPFGTTGRLPDGYPTLQCHSSSITDLCFDPFSQSVLATTSKENTVKFWRVGETSKHPNEPLVELLHSKKISTIGFHPSASSVFHSTCQDGFVRLYDLVEAGKEKITFPSSDVFSLSWNPEGSSFVLSLKEKRILLCDPRHSQTIMEKKDIHSARGFSSLWISEQTILSCGFNKTNQHELNLWDIRKNLNSLNTCTLDSTTSTPLIPSYDNVGLLILQGNFERVLWFYTLFIKFIFHFLFIFFSFSFHFLFIFFSFSFHFLFIFFSFSFHFIFISFSFNFSFLLH
jgi:WD40 repeat protein